MVGLGGWSWRWRGRRSVDRTVLAALTSLSSLRAPALAQTLSWVWLIVVDSPFMVLHWSYTPKWFLRFSRWFRCASQVCKPELGSVWRETEVRREVEVNNSPVGSHGNKQNQHVLLGSVLLCCPLFGAVQLSGSSVFFPFTSSFATSGFPSHLALSSLRIQALWADFYYTWQKILLRCWSVFKNSGTKCKWSPASNTGRTISLLSASPIPSFPVSPSTLPTGTIVSNLDSWVQKLRTADRKIVVRYTVASGLLHLIIILDTFWNFHLILVMFRLCINSYCTLWTRNFL